MYCIFPKEINVKPDVKVVENQHNERIWRDKAGYSRTTDRQGGFKRNRGDGHMLKILLQRQISKYG